VIGTSPLLPAGPASSSAFAVSPNSIAPTEQAETCRAASVRRDPVARGEKPIEVSNHTTAKRKASELGQVFRIVPEDASKYVAGGEYPVPGNPERAEASQSLPGHWRWRAAIGQSRTG
jgi:hypothetical protein